MWLVIRWPRWPWHLGIQGLSSLLVVRLSHVVDMGFRMGVNQDHFRFLKSNFLNVTTRWYTHASVLRVKKVSAPDVMWVTCEWQQPFPATPTLWNEIQALVTLPTKMISSIVHKTLLQTSRDRRNQTIDFFHGYSLQLLISNSFSYIFGCRKWPSTANSLANYIPNSLNGTKVWRCYIWVQVVSSRSLFIVGWRRLRKRLYI
jgi:hypothetical protein